MEKSFEPATKLRRELPSDVEMESIHLEELFSLVEDIHVKTRQASQNTLWGCFGAFLGYFTAGSCSSSEESKSV